MTISCYNNISIGPHWCCFW